MVHELRVSREDQGEGFDAYQLPLTVEVRSDDHPVRFFRERRYGLGYALLRNGLQDLRVYELPRLYLLPAGVLLGILGVQDVPLEADGDRLLVLPRERVVGHGAVLPLLHGAFGEELGDLLRSVCLLGNN